MSTKTEHFTESWGIPSDVTLFSVSIETLCFVMACMTCKKKKNIRKIVLLCVYDKLTLIHNEVKK